MAANVEVTVAAADVVVAYVLETVASSLFCWRGLYYILTSLFRYKNIVKAYLMLKINLIFDFNERLFEFFKIIN